MSKIPVKRKCERKRIEIVFFKFKLIKTSIILIDGEQSALSFVYEIFQKT